MVTAPGPPSRVYIHMGGCQNYGPFWIPIIMRPVISDSSFSCGAWCEGRGGGGVCGGGGESVWGGRGGGGWCVVA